jgi:hypothetical protein
MAFNVITDNTQKIMLTARPTYQDPNTGELVDAQVDGALQITKISGDGSVIQDPATPLSYESVSGNDLGDSVYEIRVDGDLGPGVTFVVETVTHTVVAVPPPPIPMASAFGFTASAPVPK